MSFQTPRLSFTPVTLSDKVALQELRTAPEVMKWSRQKHPDTCLQDTENWIRMLTDDPLPDPVVQKDDGAGDSKPAPGTGNGKKGVVFAVRELEHLNALKEGKTKANVEEQGDRIVAIVGAREAEAEFSTSKKMQYEIGYMFVTGVWGKGYASESVKGFVGWWFGYVASWGDSSEGEEEVDRNGLYAVVAKANRASLRVMEKVGFRKTAEGLDGDGSGTELVEFCIMSG
ncbi:GNAT domain-containing protein [Aspergillus varians]